MLRGAGQGFFFRYQGADWIQVKKQYNQTMKSPGPGELIFQFPYFIILLWQYLQKDP